MLEDRVRERPLLRVVAAQRFAIRRTCGTRLPELSDGMLDRLSAEDFEGLDLVIGNIAEERRVQALPARSPWLAIGGGVLFGWLVAKMLKR